MTRWWVPLCFVACVPASVRAEITHVASFENFNEGQSFKPSFNDPLSGITFRDVTGANSSFFIDYSATLFGGGNYLTSGAFQPGPSHWWGGSFGFSATLPAAARRVAVEVSYPAGSPATIRLRTFNKAGVMIAQQVGTSLATDGHATLEVQLPTYDIWSVQVSGGDQGLAYDNLSYTVIPEPGALGVAIFGSLLALRGRS